MKHATQVKMGVAAHHVTLIALLLFDLVDAWAVNIVLACALMHVVQAEYLHRGVSHRWIRFDGWRQYVAAYVPHLLCSGSAFAFTLAHRTHHVYSDTERDPHSPRHIGVARVWLTLWPVFTAPTGIVRDLMRHPAFLQAHNYYAVFCAALYVLAAAASFDVLAVLSLTCVLGFHRAGLYNTAGHLVTSDPWWLRWLTRHRRHHENPAKV
jgi:fatty-acid desaturase